MKKVIAALLAAALLLTGCGAAAMPEAPSVSVQTQEQLDEILSAMSQDAQAQNAQDGSSPAPSAPEKSEVPAPSEEAQPRKESAPSVAAPAQPQDNGLRPDKDVFSASAGSSVDSAGRVTMSIECSQAVAEGTMSWLPADGWILKEESFEIEEGETAFTLLLRVTREKKIHMEYTGSKSSAYIRGMYNLYEKDCGGLSGWMIRVNGEIIPVSSGQYALYDGDEVEWFYTVDYTREE